MAMTMDEKIARINELYHISQKRELTPEEAEEKKFLYKAYIDSVKMNLGEQLKSIRVQDEDGDLHPLHKKGE